MAQDNFKRYDSPEQYAEAFQQMIDMILAYYQDFLKHVPVLYTTRNK